MHKPPYSKITAIDMNTGEHAWEVSVGEASDQLKRHPALRNTDLSGVGGRGRAVMMVTKSLLFATEGSNGPPVLNAHDKATGVKLGTTELPAPGMYGDDDLHARGPTVHRGPDWRGRGVRGLVGGAETPGLGPV